MKKLSQFGIILLILLLGQVIQESFKLAIPATIIAMVILLILLIFKLLKVAWVDDISKSLLDNLSILFVPAGVAIVKEIHLFENQYLPILAIIVITTILVMVVTAYTVQSLIGSKGRKKK